MTPRLPVVGGDRDQWGTILNEFLGVGHTAAGDLHAKNGTLLLGADASLYRLSAGELATDGKLSIGTDLFAYGNRVRLTDGPTGTGAIYFGTATDTNLYRLAAGTLKSDGTLELTGNMYAGGRVLAYNGTPNQTDLLNGQLIFGNAGDTNLYRLAANQLKTDDEFHVAKSALIGTDGGGVSSRLWLGSAGDVSLWRDSPAVAALGGSLLMYNGSLQFNAGGNIILPTATGTKLGTAATQLLGFWNATPRARPTGWAAPTGTATRTTFATGSVTLPLLAERVKALIDDLTSMGLIGT